YTIVSTGGTSSGLENAGVFVTKVEQLTCFPEMVSWFIRPNVYWSMIRTTYDDGDEKGSSNEDVVETFMGASRVNIAGDATTKSFEEHDLDID
ncbi:hypothetical protein U1Q18_048387, partial [Sarracenia purpurea var. burkii]